MTTDTKPRAPTDAEIIALMGDPRYSTIGAVREAISRWGQLYTAPQPAQAQAVAREPLSAEQYNILVEDLSEWSRHVEVDTAPRSLEEHIHQVFAIHGIKGGQHGADT